MFGLKDWVFKTLSDWLTLERPPEGLPLYDFERMAYELRPGDALLVEGRTRVGSVIKTISESPWTHSALYIGCLHDVDDADMRHNLLRHYDGNPSTQLLVEAVMGQGTILTPLETYRDNHMRICRPTGLSRKDAQKVIGFAIRRLGADYDVRQLLDLARFLFPYAIIPRTWRSVLFQHNAGGPTRTVCSTLMAEAFGSVNFPVLPVIEKDASGKMTFYHRNPRLFAPRDFDYSPYFDIIKYPFVAVSAAQYQDLPWDVDGMFCNSAGDCYTVASPGRIPADRAPLHYINLLHRTRFRPAGSDAPPVTAADPEPVPDTDSEPEHPADSTQGEPSNNRPNNTQSSANKRDHHRDAA